MTEKPKCPLCGKEMETWRDTLDGGCLLEEGERCSDGHYSESYNTGTTEFLVMGRLWAYYHTAAYEEKEKIGKQVDEYLKLRKMFWWIWKGFYKGEEIR